MTGHEFTPQSVILEYGNSPGILLPVLKKIQETCGDLSMETQKLAADALGLSLAQVAGVVSFYSFFNKGGSVMDSMEINLPSPPGETRLLLANVGKRNPDFPADSVFCSGYEALKTAVFMPDDIIEAIAASGLRGRSGAGFPVGVKWNLVRKTPADVKYVICNADEGEPDSAKDLVLMTRAPHLILEGMVICGLAVGADKGYVYIRGEYPRAVRILDKALADARANGYLGDDILDTGFHFDIELRIGAGSYAVGEETALIESIEGRRGEPRVKPPFPGIAGLWRKPTVVNNVETFANIPVILKLGAEEFKKYGTERCSGTKLFTLGGCVANPGVYEFPMGVTMRELFDHAGGMRPDGGKLKGIQVGGGASGAFVGTDFLDVPMDMDSCAEKRIALGTGSLMFFDEHESVVELCRRSIEFLDDESCGKCVPCRFGNKRMADILGAMSKGAGTLAELKELEELADFVGRNSLCGLGQAAPAVVHSLLRNFRPELEAQAG